MDRIFVSVASYRDKDCPETIKSLYKNAKNPNRIFVGICEQNKEGDVKCINIEDYEIQRYINNIRIKSIPYTEAKGPTYARYICSKLWNGEEYYFQIDSHTRVVKDWDEKLINMNKILSKKNKKNVITHYGPSIEDYKDYEKNKDSTVTCICSAFFNDRGMIAFHGAQHMDMKNELVKNPYVSGNMFFCKSDFLKELPYDPHLDYLFMGEEILQSIRFWTNGWDIYTPSENIAYHYYTRDEDPKIWTDLTYSDEKALTKVKEIIGLKESKVNHEYGLGKERTLDDYYKFAGIDINNKTIKNFYNGNIESNQSNNIPIMILLFILIVIVIIMIYFYIH
jgi:hypothetical protein